MTTAKVVVANYGALLHDFPHCFGDAFRQRYAEHFCADCSRRGRICNRALDAWILANAAFVSLQQSLPNEVNSPIECGPPSSHAWRPAEYGRALVVRTEGEAPPGKAGLLDLKGCGVAPGLVPSRAMYSDGLEYLGVALGDFFFSWLIDRIFERTVPGYSTVPTYAVLDLGFDLVDGWHGTGPAGMHVRRAHARNERGNQLPMSGSEEELVKIQIELILRTFGLTTATSLGSYKVVRGPEGDRVYYYGKPLEPKDEREAAKLEQLVKIIGPTRLEHTNIQLTRGSSWSPKFAQMVDFGHVQARRIFRFPLTTPARDTVLRIGRVLQTDDPAFVQPRPGLAVSGELFSRTSVNSFAFYAAQAFRSGRMSSREIGMIMRKAVARAGV